MVGGEGFVTGWLGRSVTRSVKSGDGEKGGWGGLRGDCIVLYGRKDEAVFLRRVVWVRYVCMYGLCVRGGFEVG